MLSLDKRKEDTSSTMVEDHVHKSKKHEEAIEFYQTALITVEELEDKEMQATVAQKLGTSYVDLASVCYEDFEYETAKELYENASNILETECCDVQYEKALIGLGVTWSSLRNTEKAIEAIHKVQKFYKNETDNVKGNCYTHTFYLISYTTFSPKSCRNTSLQIRLAGNSILDSF